MLAGRSINTRRTFLIRRLAAVLIAAACLSLVIFLLRRTMHYHSDHERLQFRTHNAVHKQKNSSTAPINLLHHKLTVLSSADTAPFSWSNSDIRNQLQNWKASTTDHSFESMAKHLWSNFHIHAERLGNPKGMPNTIETLFEMNIKRHIALHYQTYLLLGGIEPRHFGVPVCSTIGITDLDLKGNQSHERRTKSLDRLAGSQGSLAYYKIATSIEGNSSPFNPHSDHTNLIIKHYFASKNRHHHHHGGEDDTNHHTDAATSTGHDDDSSSAVEEDVNQTFRIFGKEFYAHSQIYHPNVIQPVCYAKEPRPIMLFPQIKGGDLVPLATDHLDKGDPANSNLNPEESFLPRFFLQLIHAVNAVHQKNLLHLDIKPENLVIAGPDRLFSHIPSDQLDSSAAYSLILLDFGMAMTLDEIESSGDNCIKVGTDVTMAPEQFLCNAPTSRGTDWWAVGASIWRTRVFWEPTLTADERDALMTTKCEQWGHYSLPMQPFFSDQLKSLLSELFLIPSPDQRDHSANQAAFEKLISHPYFANVHL